MHAVCQRSSILTEVGQGRDADKEHGLVRVHARVGHGEDARGRVPHDEVLVRKGPPASKGRRAAAPIV